MIRIDYNLINLPEVYMYTHEGTIINIKECWNTGLNAIFRD